MGFLVQVNVGGEIHALQVLEAANPFIKVLSSPVEYLGALWLPFRRDHNLIKEAVQQSGSIKAIFGHLDVVGAFLNEACQAKEGIEASIFPTHLPVYTGHYHKAHVVEGTQIEYIGSPYQVSAGESEQTKRFVVLNRHWQKIGEIPVNIGPRHFSIVQTEESSHEIVKCARAGDRIRWHVSSNTFDDSVKSQLVCDNPQTLQASFKLQLFSFVSFDCLGTCWDYG
jgi:DNA repair exonuclease SbcCD nuclease subunit